MRKQFFLKSLFGCVLGISLFFFKQASADELSLSNWRLAYLLLEDLQDTIEQMVAEQKDVVCAEVFLGNIGEAIYDALETAYPHLILIAPAKSKKQWLVASKYPIEENLAEKTFSLFSIQGEKEPIAHLCLAQTEETSPAELSRIVDTADTLLEESESPCIFCGEYDTVRSLERIYREKIATIIVPFAGGFCAVRVSLDDEQLLPFPFQSGLGFNILCSADAAENQGYEGSPVGGTNVAGSTKDENNSNNDAKNSENRRRFESNVTAERTSVGINGTLTVKHKDGTKTTVQGDVKVGKDNKGNPDPKLSAGVSHEW